MQREYFNYTRISHFFYVYLSLRHSKHNYSDTHAARQLSSGFWTSKLGEAYDIQHGTPQSIEGGIYGCVYCYMKKAFE